MTAAHEFRAWHDAAVPKQKDAPKPDRIDWMRLRLRLAEIIGDRKTGVVLRKTNFAPNTLYRAVNLERYPKHKPDDDTIAAILEAFAPDLLPVGAFMAQFESVKDLKDTTSSARKAASTLRGGDPHATRSDTRAVSTTDQAIIDAVRRLAEQIADIGTSLAAYAGELAEALDQIANRSLPSAGSESSGSGEDPHQDE